MLAGALNEAPDRVAADLRRFYGVRLSDLRAGYEDVLEVAHYVAHMPPGGALGAWYGGELAVSPETAAVWENTHVLAQVNSKKKIKPRPMPDGVRDVKRKGDRAVLMAAKYRRKRGGGSHG